MNSDIKITLHGGEMMYSAMNSQVNAKEYSLRKMYAWFTMLNDRQRPITWKKPSKKGTRVKWEMVTTQQEYEMAWDELEGYIHAVNKRFATDFALKRVRAGEETES
ncbi:hypothetical protein [Paenibacillus popilliae]|uniref:Enoyl-[acyl-carrier-protein] reductase n=2 Tax=Paenibacillus popilliae ATCC 14706 TaxID=1212764 RepID=M9LAT0_PAEPP|nr:hypothetical protein [Paenibacillus popilliae]GAC42817.1 enoyl-[acyl-carrier-protein] reductase [Paenibacillus popilliae ATCC 14706]